MCILEGLSNARSCRCNEQTFDRVHHKYCHALYGCHGLALLLVVDTWKFQLTQLTKMISATDYQSNGFDIYLVFVTTKLLLMPVVQIYKVSDLQSALELPSKVAAVDVILGFPSVLGLSTERLAVKYQQLKTLAQQRRDWQQQLLHLRQHKPGSLGRVLAAGPRVVDRLKYLLDAGEADQTLDNSRGGSSIRDFYDSSSISCQHQAAEDRGRRMTKSSVCKGGFAGGNLAALLIMSEGTFMNLHPEFGLWRLEQRSTVPIKYA